MSLFEQAIDSIENFKNSNQLDLSEKSYIEEAASRLKNIEDRFIGVTKLNDEYIESDLKILEIRDNFSEEKVFKMLTAQADVDPKLKEWLQGKSSIKVESKTEISTFNLTENNDDKVSKLHTATESIYHDLWSIKERLDKVSKYKNFNPAGVRDVRNHLIVHADKYAATLYSFGVQTRGPVLRPVKPSNAKANHDKGLVSNVEEFLNEIINIGARDTIEPASENK